MEIFVLMHDALSKRFHMIDFKKVAWDPVLQELSQSGCMKKCIVEYFEEIRTRKPRSDVQVKVVDAPNALYAVHTFCRSSATLI